MKKFRLLLMLASLFAMVFTTACDKTEPSVKPCTVSVEVVENSVSDTSFSFTVTTTDAISGRYWILTAAEDEGLENLELAKAKSLAEINATVTVEATALAPATEYHVYAYAENLVHHAFTQQPLVVTTAAEVPAATVVIEEEEIGSNSAAIWVTTAHVSAASWLCVPMGEAVTAETVVAEGTALTTETGLNGDAFVEVEDLEANSYYDFYVVITDLKGNVTLAPVYNFKTADKSALVLNELTFDIVEVMDPATHGMPGVFYFTLSSSTSNDNATFYIYDFTGATYCSDLYPTISSETWEPTEEDPRGLDLNESGIVVNMTPYTFVEGIDPIYNEPYGVTILTALGNGSNYNMIQLNLLCVDDAGNEAKIQVDCCYEGEIPYAGSVAQTTTRDLSSFTSYTYKLAEDGKTVTLTANNYAGSVKLDIVTTDGTLGGNYCVEEGTILPTSYYFEPLDDWTFMMTSGNLFIEKVEGKENTYTFTMSSRRGGLKAEMTQPMALICEFTPLDTNWEVTITPAE